MLVIYLLNIEICLINKKSKYVKIGKSLKGPIGKFKIQQVPHIKNQIKVAIVP
jgi:hypothetical protein